METPSQVSEGKQSRKKMNWKKILIWTLAAVLILFILFRIAGSFLFQKSDSGSAKVVTPTVSQFRHEIAVRGDVSSSENKDIKCQVRSSGGVMITWVVDEGTEVKEGDVIATLDSSALIDSLDAQINKVAQSEAEVKAAENDLTTALIAKEEYENGTYKVNLQKLVSSQIQAKEERDRLAEYLQHSKLLYEKGFVTKSQLEADVFSLKQAELNLRAAELDIYVLKEFTHNKSSKNYESNIETARANLSAKLSVHQQNETKLKDIEQQIEYCTIKSPGDGKVLYVNETNRFGTSEFLVCQGAMVRERQTFLRLPNSTKLQVTADIHEGKISYVRQGQHVEIRTDATGEKIIKGTVIKVNENPQPTNHWMGNVKEYRVTIEMEETLGVLPGMTAETNILVEETDDEKVMIPTHAVFEHGGDYYCIEKKEDGSLEPIVVELGSSNDKMVIVTSSNVTQQTQLLAAAFENRERITLPQLPDGQTSSASIRPNRENELQEIQGADKKTGQAAGKMPGMGGPGMGGPGMGGPGMGAPGMGAPGMGGPGMGGPGGPGGPGMGKGGPGMGGRPGMGPNGRMRRRPDGMSGEGSDGMNQGAGARRRPDGMPGEMFGGDQSPSADGMPERRSRRQVEGMSEGMPAGMAPAGGAGGGTGTP